MYSPSGCVWNTIDKQYDILAVSVVNTGGELPGLTVLKRKGKEPSGDTFLSPLEEQQGHHALAGR